MSENNSEYQLNENVDVNANEIVEKATKNNNTNKSTRIFLGAIAALFVVITTVSIIYTYSGNKLPDSGLYVLDQNTSYYIESDTDEITISIPFFNIDSSHSTLTNVGLEVYFINTTVIPDNEKIDYIGTYYVDGYVSEEITSKISYESLSYTIDISDHDIQTYSLNFTSVEFKDSNGRVVYEYEIGNNSYVYNEFAADNREDSVLAEAVRDMDVEHFTNACAVSGLTIACTLENIDFGHEITLVGYYSTDYNFSDNDLNVTVDDGDTHDSSFTFTIADTDATGVYKFEVYMVLTIGSKNYYQFVDTITSNPYTSYTQDDVIKMLR